MELTLDGQRYTGKFVNVGQKEREELQSGEFFDYFTNYYWYEGVGSIKDKKTRKKYTLLLKTSTRLPPSTPLENCIVRFREQEAYSNERRVEESRIVPGAYLKIIDLSLGELVSRIKESKEDIPTLQPIRLTSEYLIDHGLIFGDDGQIHLPLYEKTQ